MLMNPRKTATTKREPAAPTVSVQQTVQVAITDIGHHPRQPRQEFKPEDLARLAKSISEHDLLQPVGLRATNRENGHPYELLWGERRLRAAQMAGCKTIAATIRQADQIDALVLIGEENLCREDWNPIERGEYLRTLSAPKARGGGGMTIKEIALHFTRSESWAKNSIRLLKLPEAFKQRVVSGEMSESKARLLLPYIDNEAMMGAVEEDLTSNPKLWRTREEMQTRLEVIAGCILAINEPAASSEAHEQPAPRSTGPKAVAASDEPASSAAEGRRPSIDSRRFQKYLPVVEPYQDSLRDLEALRDLVDTMIAKLKGGLS